LLPFQQETLTQAGVKKENRVSLTDHSLIHCEELIMPSATCLSGNVSPWIIDYLRLAFKDWMQADSTFPRNLFIARRKGGKRVLLNEGDVVKALEFKNFKVIYLEELSVQQQVKLFYNAGQIIGVHGAGLTNLLFSRPGCFVLELFPINYVNQCYWTIASYNELTYAYLLGEGNDITDEINHLVDGDFCVSVEKLLQLLEDNKT
jgi:capsular polysaccharide biosynthesis protein